MSLFLSIILGISLLVLTVYSQSRIFRFIATVILIPITLVLAHSHGELIGKTKELNRFARVFPEILRIIKSKHDDDRNHSMIESLDFFENELSSSSGLNSIETILMDYEHTQISEDPNED